MSNYLVHYNHNHDALGRFARSAGGSVGEKIVSAGKKENNNTRKYESNKRLAGSGNDSGKIKVKKANDVVAKNKEKNSNNKEKGSKSNNTKLSDSERKRLIESASLKEVTANKDKLSNRELESAINRLQKEKTTRIDLEKKLSDLNSPANKKTKQTGMEKVQKIGKDMETAANAINSGIKLYNNVAMVYNRGKGNGEKLPMIGQNNNDVKPRPWVQAIINSGDAVKAAKYASDMTPEERKKVQEAMKVMTQIQTNAEVQKKGKSK